MRLTAKLILMVLAGIFTVHAIYAYLRILRESNLFEFDMHRDHRILGSALADATSRVWATRGEMEALDLIEDANSRRSYIDISWMSLNPVDASGVAVDSVLRAELIAGQRISRKERDADGESYIKTCVPVIVGKTTVGAVALRESLAAKRKYIRDTIVRASLATATTAGVCGLITMVLGAWLVGRPIRMLVDKARRIGTGDLSGRIGLRQHDEIGGLSEELNRMCDRLAEARDRVETETASRIAAMEQLRHADRLTTVGKLASGVAHELGTPLNVVIGRAKMIAGGEVSGDEARENARTVVQQGERMTRIVRNLLDFSRRRDQQKSPADLGKVVGETLNLLVPMANKNGVMMEQSVTDDPLIARIDAGQIQQALTNIAINAIQAMPRGGRLAVRTGREHIRPPPDHGGPERDYTRISIRDEGGGIPAEALPRIFDPFFTTKGVGEGTGLGLSVVYGIVREHGGWVKVETEPGKGSCFSVYLPAETET